MLVGYRETANSPQKTPHIELAWSANKMDFKKKENENMGISTKQYSSGLG